jgi:hypothetical protein
LLEITFQPTIVGILLLVSFSLWLAVIHDPEAGKHIWPDAHEIQIEA